MDKFGTERNMRDIDGRCAIHGDGWLVSMQHFCLHDCVAFAIWYVLAIGGVVVALCTFCDALDNRGHVVDSW